jgi:hypothetical protein
VDSSTWQALGLTLTAVGLVLSVLLWRRRGPASGLRGVAWALLPAAAGLTGTLRLLWDIGDSVVSWAARLVFSPVVWLGVMLAGLSAVLFVVSGAMRNRGVGTRRPEVGSTSDRQAIADQPSRRPAQKPAGRGAPAVKDDDMDDIEAILRKHGIS